jgi:hypothetical protein
VLELAHPLDAIPQPSPLADARSHRDLSIKQVAYRSGLSVEEIEWLEEGRLYRFASQNAAILAAVVYATALGALLSALVLMVMSPNLHLTRTRTIVALPNAGLLPPWKLKVTVENGGGDVNWARTVASRVGAMGYTIVHVGPADRFDYKRATVFYGAGGVGVGVRLARQLAVTSEQAPGLKANQLLVITGPKTF